MSLASDLLDQASTLAGLDPMKPKQASLRAEVACCNNKEFGLGSRFLAAVEDVTARTLADPLTGIPASESTRRMFLKDFPFAIVYRADEDGVEMAQSDGQWRRAMANGLLPSVFASEGRIYDLFDANQGSWL